MRSSYLKLLATEKHQLNCRTLPTVCITSTTMAVKLEKWHQNYLLRRSKVVVITTAQLQSTKSELRFCTGSNLAHVVSEIRDGEDL